LFGRASTNVNSSNDKDVSPPANFLKLVEQNRQKPTQNPKPTQKNVEATNKAVDPDQQLAERLAKLGDQDKKRISLKQISWLIF
jgi:hypothetical protein